MISKFSIKNSLCAVLVMFSGLVLAQDVSVDITAATENSFTPGTIQNNSYSFTVKKTNAMVGNVSGLTVTGSFDIIAKLTGLTWTCGVPSGGVSDCLTASGSGAINTSIDLNDTIGVVFTFTNIQILPDVFTNMNFIVASNDTGSANDDMDSKLITRASLTEINVNVSNGATTYTPGVTGVDYQIDVTNEGPSDADNIDFSHVVPAGMVITSWSCSAGANSSCSDTGGNNSTVNPQFDIRSGESATVIVTANYLSSVRTATLDYSATATVTDIPNAEDPMVVSVPVDTNPATDTDSDSLNLESNLQITIDTAPVVSNYTPGTTNQIYTVVVTNTGPSDVLTATIVDNNLSELQNISWTCAAIGGSSCSSGTGQFSTTADIVAGATNVSSVTYTIEVDYDSAATTNPLIYTVTATNPSGSPTVSGTSPVIASKSLVYDPVSNLTMALDDGMMTSYTPGLNGEFTAVITNSGPSDVTGVTVIDNDIADFESVTWTCTVTDANSLCPDGTGAVNTTANIAAGDTATYVITGAFDSSTVTNPLVYTLTATNPMGVRGTSPATQTDNDNVLDRQVNLSITKTGKVGSLVPNEPFTYTILISNAGPSDLGADFTTDANGLILPTENGVILNDVLNPLLVNHPTRCSVPVTDPPTPPIETPCWEYCSSDRGAVGPDGQISPDNCPLNSEVIFDAGNELNFPVRIASGNSSEIRVYARLSSGAGTNCDAATSATNEVCNSASITIHPDETVTTRNVGTDPLTDDTSNEIVIGTDLVVTKTDNLTTIAPGTDNTYEIVVRNDGFINAEGVSVVDMLPIYPNLAAGFIAGSISWTCETSDVGACCNSQTSSCGLGAPTPAIINDQLMASIDLDAQTEVTFKIKGDIAAQATGILTNSVTATLPNGIDEVNTLNNTDITDTTSLGDVSDIELVKSLVSAEQDTNDPTIVHLKYKVEVTNLGPSSAASINVVDQLDDANIDAATRSWTCAINVNDVGACTTPGPVTNSGISTQVSLDVDSTAVFIVDLSSNSNASGRIVNVASATTTGFDPVDSNNSDSVEYSLTGASELTISNNDAKITATPGLPTAYTIRITNQGPDDVFGANVIDVFPPQLSDIEWSCSAVSPIPGDLTFYENSPTQGAAGTHMIVSPDDSHIYVTVPDVLGVDSKIYVFKRNTIIGSSFGQVIQVETITQGVNSVDGIETPIAMQMSSSGQHLYVLSDVVAGSTGVPAIAIFGRDTNQLSADFGKLTYLGLMSTNIPTNPEDILLSNDQKHVYVTGDGNIQAYTRDAGSGLLIHVATEIQADAGVMSQSPSASQIYVVDASGGNVNAYLRDNLTGGLAVLNSINDLAISNVSDIVASVDGFNFYLTATGSSKIVVLDRNISTGNIGLNTSYDDLGLSFNSTETLVGMTSINISQDGEHVFVGNPNVDALFVLGRNSQGLLSKKEKITVLGLDQINDVVVSLDGKHVFTTAEGTNGKTLTVLDRRQPDPVFSFVEAEIDGMDDVRDTAGTVDGLLGASAVVVSDDGKHVYVAGLGDNSIAVFERDKTKGSTEITRGLHLNFITSYNDSDVGISNLVDIDSMELTPNGNFLYVGSSDEATLTVFARASDGTLTFVDTYSHTNNVIDGLLGVSSITVDSSSQHLYVAGKFEASVAHYSIQVDGTLVLEDSVANGDAGVSGMAGARSLAISPDGKHILVASSIDDSVVVLSRSPLNGEITFMQRLSSVGDQPMDLSISPDGEHVYVVAANDSRLTVLKRVTNVSSTNFGRVSIVASYFDGVDGFDYLLGARSVAISNDGSKVYLGAEFDSAITIMDRDQNPNSNTFGELTVVESQIDDVGSVVGLGQLYDLVVSNDSKNVYAVGFSDNALTAFVLGSGSACSAQGSGNIDDLIDVGVNGTVTYTVNAKIRPNATGSIVTEARIVAPENFVSNNPIDICSSPAIGLYDSCDVDSTDLVPVTDLTITKTDNRLSVVAGEPVQYEIVVSNNGPSNAKSTTLEKITVVDTLNNDFVAASVNWTCDAIGSGSLAFTQSVSNGTNGIVGLQGVSSLAIASDLAGLGPHVLATSVVENGLLAFEIDQVTGELSQVLQMGDFIQAESGINLAGARDVIVIDNDIYVASQVDDSLVAFKASNSSGLDIAWVANHSFSSGVVGLNQSVAVVASSDGKNIYVAGANDNSVVVFDRNLTTGILSPASLITEGDSNGSLGLSGVNALAISADSYSVYTSGVNNGKLGVYKRNLVDGSLQLVEVLDSLATLVPMTGISAVSLSSDDKQVYVVSKQNNALYVFSRKVDVAPTDSTYGSLTLQQEIYQNVNNVVGLLAPANITASDDGRHVYVASEQSDAVVWFARNLETGNLTIGGLVNNASANFEGLDGAISVEVGASGEFVYVAGSQANAIAVLSRLDDSFCLADGVGNIQTEVDVAVNGSLVFTLNATVASDATGDVDGNLVNSAGVYSCFEPAPADLTTCVLGSATAPGSDPVSSNNINSDKDTINPIADLMITKTDGLSQYNGLSGAVKVTGNVDNLYVAAKGENAIGIFSRESNSGSADFGDLKYFDNVQNGVNGISGLLAVSDVLLSDDGKTLYAAGTGDNSVVVFARNLSTGALSFIEKHSSGIFGVAGIEGVKSLAISADGMHLYATGPLTNSLAVFTIDPLSGQLTFAQKLQNAVAGVSGLVSASDVQVSVDGKHVYITSNTENSVSVFLRNPNSASISFGQLSYLITYSNGVDGVAGLEGASALTMSTANDGEYVYVLGSAQQSIAVFSRDTATGELSFIEFKQNGTSNVVGLTLAKDLKISADETSLYVAGFAENALVQFDRNTTDGTLSFVDVINDGDILAQPGQFVDGLTGASGVFIADDDSHVYIAGAGDNAISGFSRDTSGLANQNGNILYQQVLIDNEGGVSPGTEITYVITVSNAGPSNVERAKILDVFPPEFEEISYECFPLAGAMCAAGVQIGNVDIVADIPVGASVEITATGMIKSDAVGTLVNTATVASSTNPVFSITDPDLTNNSATDDDTLLSPAVDLVVTKDNGLTELIPGTAVNYTITVSNDVMLAGNNEPADVSNVLVTDVVPEEISNVNWTCEAFPQPGLLDDGDDNDLINSYINYNGIDLHNDMVLNQSGTHAYVTGVSSVGSVVLVYQRNQRTGELSEVQRLINGTDGVSGLAGAQGLVLSADQKYVYIASEIDDSIVTFAVDSITANLTFIDIKTDGLSGVNGIGGAKDVVISIDGSHVYVAGKLDNAIAIFNRNAVSGVLTFNTLLSGVEGLSGVESMVFDSTGVYLLVVAESNDSLASFKRNASTGVLTAVDVIQDFEIVDSVLLQPVEVVMQGTKVYVASFASDAISVFDLDVLTGILSYDYAIHHGDTNVTQLQGPSDLVFSDSGNELYVASSVSASITLFALQNDALSPLNIVYDTSIIPGLDSVTQLVIDPIGNFFYALSDDLVLALVLNGSHCGNSIGAGNLNDVADISSGGHLTYMLQGDIQPAVTGVLTNTATALPGSDVVELFPPDNSASDIDTLTPISDLSVNKTDNLLEVVAGTPLTYDISVFSAGPSSVNASIIDAMPLFPTDNAGFFQGSIDWQCSNNKTLQFNAEYLDDSNNGLNNVSDVLVSSDGLFAYATSAADASIAIFNRNVSGELTFLTKVNENDVLNSGVVTGLTGAASLVLDQSDSFLYVISESANSIVVLSRDTVTGTLDFVQKVSSGVDGVIGMTGPVKAVVTPDNAALYIAAKGSNAITVFSRDVDSGGLFFVERVRDGFGTIVPESNVIVGITDILVSFDGEYIYTAADSSNAIAIFARNPITHILTFVQVVREGDLHSGVPVAGLSGVQSIVMSPGSSYLYAVATNDSSLLTFSRNLNDGQLVYQNVLQVGDPDSGEIVMPTDVMITPDGGRLMIADSNTQSVSLFDRSITTGAVSLVDVFTNSVHGSSLLVEPKELVTDGVNILVVSQVSNALVALRITAQSDCLVDMSTPDIVTANLYMNPGSAGGVNVQALVHPSARGIINNTANIIPILGAGDNDLSNNFALDQTTITIETDVEIIKTGPTDAIAGESIAYNLVLTNTGPSDALGVRVQDILDPAVINATWTCTSTGRSLCNDINGVGSVDTLVNVGIDGQITIVISATISSAFIGDLDNTATAIVIEEGFNTDTNLLNNTSTISTAVTMVADLSVTKTNNQTIVLAGEVVVYDIVVTNNGPSDAPDNLLIDIVPSVLVNVTWTCVTDAASSCTATGSGDINDVSYIAANSQLTYQVTGFIPSATEEGLLDNTAVVEVRQPATDPDTSNNTANDTDAIEIHSDVMIALTSSINPYDPDGPVNLPYLLDVTNVGPSDARNVSATFNIAANATYQMPFRCVEQTPQQISCDIGYMVAGENKKFPLEFRVIQTTPTTISSSAEVTTTTFDPDLNNNVSNLDIDLLTGIDIRVTKSNGADILRLGFITTYFIRIDNIGSIDAGDVNVIETLPVELINATWTCNALNGATCLSITGSSVTTATGNLPSGGILEYVVTATLDPSIPNLEFTEISNTVESYMITTTGDQDYQLLNNIATDTDVVLRIIFIDDFEGSVP